MMAALKRIMRPKYFTFTIVVLALTVTSLIPTECPVCHGSGILKATPGMENVKITDVETELMTAIFNGCDMYILYNFELKITVENANTHPIEGWIKTTLLAKELGRELDFQYVPVAIPDAINASIPYKMIVTYSIWYQTQIESVDWIEVETEVVNESIEDATCKGTGRISLNMLPIVSALEEDLRKEGNIEIPYQPPIWYIPSFE